MREVRDMDINKDKEYIALRVHAVAKGKLENVPFDKGLPILISKCVV